MEVATLLLTIASLVLAFGGSAHQVVLGRLNSETKSAVSKLTSAVTKALGSKRLNLNKILSLLSAKQNAALTSYMGNNPIVAKTLAEITNDSEVINRITADQSSLENKIATLQAELSSAGYASSHKGTGEEQAAVSRVKGALNKALSEYDDLTREASKYGTSSTRPGQVYTKDIDAVTQNLQGGLK